MSGDRQLTEIEDFADVLCPDGNLELPVVVGGHAVNLWASYFLTSGIAELGKFLPFTSKDLDFVGSSELLEAMHRRFSGIKKMGQPRSPVVGRLELPFHGGVRIVELLHAVKGLSFEELKRHVDITVKGVSARVLLPQLMLKAKIDNCVTIEQDGRNDVKHVAMMILCTRAFIQELLRLAEAGSPTPREVVNLLEEVRDVVSSSLAAKASQLWGFDFSTAWPMDRLALCGMEKIERFVRFRLTEPG